MLGSSGRIIIGSIGLAVLLTLVGCGGAPRGGGMKPSLEVKVAKPSEAPITDYEDFTGRTEAIKSVTLKARASGYLDKVLFTDGQFVKAGDQLYQIDDRTYKTQVENAKAAIKRTEAELERSNADLARARKMSLGDAISREDYDKIVARKQTATATLSDNKATLDSADLNLGFCKVSSPIDGIISKTQITEGNLVAQDQTTLTTIVSVDPIYAYFDIDERTVLRLQEMIRSEASPKGIEIADKQLKTYKVGDDKRKQVLTLLQGKITASSAAQIDALLTGSEAPAEWLTKEILYKYPKFESYRTRPVPVLLGTQIEKGYPHEGRIDFVDNQLNANTGTLRVRGSFANSGRVLTPNLFVRIRLPVGDPHKALMVTEAAIVSEQDRKFLYVVNKDNEVEARPIILGPQRGGMRVVEGVGPDDLVIISGLQRAIPGSKVEPKQVEMPNLAPTERGPAPSPSIKKN